MTTFEIKQHDLDPPLAVTITDGVATFDQVASWKMLLKVGSTVYTDAAPTVQVALDGMSAVVTHAWVAGETDVATDQGRGEVEATWPDGRPQTFPPRSYVSFVISPDLG